VTDFFATLEDQLVEAARERRRRLRAARARRAGAVVAVLLVLGAGITAGAAALGGGDPAGTPAGTPDGTGTTSTAAPPRVSYLRPLEGVRVAVLNGTSTPGLARRAAQELASYGAVIGNVTNYDRQDVQHTRLLFAPGFERNAEIVGQQTTCKVLAPIDDHIRRIAGAEADVVLLIGGDRTASP
jgi:hypothetical protein